MIYPYILPAVNTNGISMGTSFFLVIFKQKHFSLQDKIHIAINEALFIKNA